MYIHEHFIFFYQHALTLIQDFVCPLLGMFRTIDIFTSFVFFPSVNAYWYFFIQTMGSVLSTWLCFLCNLWWFPHNQHTYKTGNKIMKNLHNPFFIFIYFWSSQSSWKQSNSQSTLNRLCLECLEQWLPLLALFSLPL